MSSTFNPLTFTQDLKDYINGNYFRKTCREKHRRQLLQSLRFIKSDVKKAWKVRKLVGEQNAPNMLSSSESDPEEDTTNDHKLVSDVKFNELVAEMTGVLDQFYVELPRKSQIMFAKSLLFDLELSSHALGV